LALRRGKEKGEIGELLHLLRTTGEGGQITHESKERLHRVKYSKAIEKGKGEDGRTLFSTRNFQRGKGLRKGKKRFAELLLSRTSVRMREGEEEGGRVQTKK